MVNTLKSLLGIEDDSKNVLLEFSIEQARQVVKDYCNINEVPEVLNSVIIKMAMDYYRNEQPGEKEVPQVVTSITEGDTSTSYSKSTSTEFESGLIKNYEKQLKRYRKVRFN